MNRRIIVLSGPVASGKSSLRDQLVHRYGLIPVRTRDIIHQLHPRLANSRRSYQRAGDRLDRETNGAWIADALARPATMWLPDALVVVDSVRKREQISAIRRAFGPRVTHVHLTAPIEVLAQRYATRDRAAEEFPTYEDVRRNQTERNIDQLAGIADVVIDTSTSSPEDVIVRAACQLGFYGRSYDPLVDVLVGGQYGSEGKGHIASYLARQYDYLVRVGGPNAGHKVYLEPRPYTFHLLPSGTLHSEAQLILAPGAVLDVETLLREISDCSVDQARLSIDPRAVIITPQDRANEQEIVELIGSTGQGVGEATIRKIRRRRGKVHLAEDVRDLRPYIRETRHLLDQAFARGQRVFIEGVQGTGLSLHHGFYPHVTSRDTTASGCLAEAGIPPRRVRKTIMVCRTYPIRVESPTDQTSGPLRQELSLQIIAERSGIPLDELQQTERTSTTDRRRRIGEFDWDLLRRAASLNAPTDIALTFADYLSIKNREARRYEQLTEPTIRFIEEVERVAAAPVSLITTRFDYRSIIDRRGW